MPHVALCLALLGAAAPAWPAEGTLSPTAERLRARLTDGFSRAERHIEAGDEALARVLLDALVLAPALTPAGRARAYYLRGIAWHRDGAYVAAAQDYTRALSFDSSHSPARFALGYLHGNGLGVARNPRLAAELIVQAARAGHAEAQYNAGLLYLRGDGVEADPVRAASLLREAAAQDYGPALMTLAGLLRTDRLGPPDPATAEALYERAADLGEGAALTHLAFMAEARAGDAQTPDPAASGEAALALYLAAANNGDPTAMARLGWLYLEGTVGAPDPAAARDWFERGAAAGSARAMAFLAYLYESGRGVEKSARRAVEWYEKAARAGDTSALEPLANLSLRLAASLEDRQTGMEWLRRAADAGSASASNGYAWMLATSPRGDQRDGDAAVRYARTAVADRRNAAFLDTLAAAYAEQGDFAAAVSTQEEAIEALSPTQAERFRGDFEVRLRAYRAGRPWREAGPDAPEPPEP